MLRRNSRKNCACQGAGKLTGLGVLLHYSQCCSASLAHACPTMFYIPPSNNNWGSLHSPHTCGENGKLSIRESVDSLCRDSADAHMIYAILKQKRYNFHHIYAKSLLKHPGFLFEWLCDQQDSYKWPKATRKTVKRKSVREQKCHFSYSSFLLRPRCSTTISRKRFKYSPSF